MRVIRYWFNDVSVEADWDKWSPDDPLDFETSIGVTVGEGKSGTDFQLTLCTPLSINRLDSQRYIFVIEKWRGVGDLVQRLDQFISDLELKSTNDIYLELSRRWFWEYELSKHR